MATGARDEDATVEILLATFDGAAYLPDQLASIERQEGASWRLLASDDASTDGTRRVLEAFAARHPERVRLLPPMRRRGPVGNFDRLLRASAGRYVCLCDQDDVWFPHKLARLREALRELEAREGDVPLLVHADLEVVGRDLEPLAPSFDALAGLGAAERTSLGPLLVQNAVTGSATMMNRALVERAVPVPREALMHDWWLALVAAAFGRVAYLPEPLGLYRQHGDNVLGARPRLRGPVAAARGLRDMFARSQRQAGSLLRRHGGHMPAEAEAIVRAYLAVPELGPVARRLQLARHGFWRHGRLRSLGLLLVI